MAPLHLLVKHFSDGTLVDRVTIYREAGMYALSPPVTVPPAAICW